MNQKIRAIGGGVLVALWLVLTVVAWFGPAKAESEAERRPLEQAPELTADSLFGGSFMADFEDYSLDQFPLRDSFRTVKSLFHYYALQQKDNNGIYLADDYAAKLEYPLKAHSVEYAASRLQYVYNTYLADTDCKPYLAIVPDKGYYLAEENGYPAMDYEEMFRMLKEKLPWATSVELTDLLDVQDYYRTDTHWRQENLVDVAARLCAAMGMTQPQQEMFTKTALQRPFYGVYYGQAALPMEPETMYVMNSRVLSSCQVYNFENGGYGKVYDMTKMNSKDLYDVYLSGAQALLKIENRSARTDRELVVFRDSFGSSLVPLLVQDYRTVTLVDIRYVSPDMLGNYLQFQNQDVLFLYSTLILNSSNSLK